MTASPMPLPSGITLYDTPDLECSWPGCTETGHMVFNILDGKVNQHIVLCRRHTSQYNDQRAAARTRRPTP